MKSIKARFDKLTSLDPVHVTNWIDSYVESMILDLSSKATTIEDERKALKLAPNLISDISIPLTYKFETRFQCYQDEIKLKAITNELVNLSLVVNSNDSLLSVSKLPNQLKEQALKLQHYYSNIIYNGKRRRLNFCNNLGYCQLELPGLCKLITTQGQMMLLCRFNDHQSLPYDSNLDQFLLIQRGVVNLQKDKIALTGKSSDLVIDCRPTKFDRQQYAKISGRLYTLWHYVYNAIKVYKVFSCQGIVKFLARYSHLEWISAVEVQIVLDKLTAEGYIELINGEYKLNN